MKLKIFVLNVLLLFLTHLVNGQDLTFSQFDQNPLLRNPALAGVFDGDLRIEGTVRNQWQSITVPYKTQALSIESKFPIPWGHSDWMTGGVQITRDVAGDINLGRTQFLPVANFHKSLSGDDDNYLSVAFMGGPVISQFDPSKLQMGDQYDPLTGSFNPNIASSQSFDKSNFTYFDMSTGISWSSSFDASRDPTQQKWVDYYVGAGVYHFNQPKVGFYTNDTSTILNPRYVFNAGIYVPLNNESKLNFTADYFRQGGNRQFFGGVMYQRYITPQSGSGLDFDVSISAGAYYRWNDALVPSIRMDVSDFSFGLSYDVTLSQLKTASQSKGGFELTMCYNFTLAKNYSSSTDTKLGGAPKVGRRRDRMKCRPPVMK